MCVPSLYLLFSNTSDSLSRTSFLAKLEMNGFSERAIRGVENWLDCQAQRGVTSGAKPRWQTCTSGFSQGSVVGPRLFTVFMNTMSSGKVGTPRKSGDDTQREGTDSTLGCVSQSFASRSRRATLSLWLL